VYCKVSLLLCTCWLQSLHAIISLNNILSYLFPHWMACFVRLVKTCRQLIVGNEPLLQRLEAANFDLAVVDGIFLMKCVYLIPHRLRLPMVTYCDIVDPLVVRLPWLPSFVPNDITTFTDRMSFVERLKNFAIIFGFSFLNPIPDSPAEVFIFSFSLRCATTVFCWVLFWAFHPKPF
jgi:UDP-glucoronosyl and UDP-glucosyl transferase